jgi:hypothetical protein
LLIDRKPAAFRVGGVIGNEHFKTPSYSNSAIRTRIIEVSG